MVALDGSPRASAVLAEALKLADAANAQLVLYRAVGLPPDVPMDVLTVPTATLEEVMLRNARDGLQRLASQVPAARIEKLVATFATAWDGICSTAKAEQVDLVVIGAHGYSVLDRVLGTTAGKVVNHCDRSVLVVRTPL
jgi:nucleotide-binding universal stress UspA family protein